MKNDRLFQLLYLLLENGATTAVKLSKALEVSVRTIYRDVDALSMAGIPICTIAGKGGGISLLPGYTFDKTLLSPEERDQLIFAMQSLKAVDLDVDNLLHKLSAAFHMPFPNWIEVDFSRWGMTQADSVRFSLLKAAILSRKTLRLTYCGVSGDSSERCIHPLKLIYKSRHWYLQAFCLKADDYRLFKVSRIIHMEFTGQTFSEKQHQMLPPYEVEALPPCSIHLTLRIAGCMAFRIYDEFPHGTAMPQPDGSFLVEIDFPMDNWLISYLLSFGVNLDVLEPLALRRQLWEHAEEIANHHKT